MSRFKAIQCVISRGGFSDERVFTLQVAGGYTGVASRQYFWKQDGSELGEGEPPIGDTMDGFIAAKIIEVHAEAVLVSIPDGEVITIPSDALLERPSWKAGANVPVGS
jgi:hypothetical protein